MACKIIGKPISGVQSFIEIRQAIVDIQHKSKAELIAELQQQQQENASLKASFAEFKSKSEELQTRLTNCEAIFESSPVAMFIIDENTNIVMVNLAGVKLCGGSEEEILQHRPGNALRCVHRSKDPRGCGYAADCRMCELRNAINTLISKGGTIDGAELEFTLNRSGEPEKVWMSVGIEPVAEEGQKHWCIAMSDITKNKHIEESLQISEERFHGIFKNLQDAFFQADLSGNFILVSPSAMRIYGYDSLDELIGMPASTLYADQTFRDQLLKELQSKGEITDFVSEGKRKDGSTFWVSMNARFLYQNGKISGTEGIVRDITERIKAEEKIRLSEEKFRAAFMTIKDGFYIGTLNEGIIIDVNAGFERIFQYTAKESIGKTSSELGLWVVPEDRAIMVSHLKEKGYCNNLETEGRKKNGERFNVSITTSILNINQVPHIVGVIRDITEQKLAEEEIIRAKQKAEESEEKFRSMFTSMQEGVYLHEMIYDDKGKAVNYRIIEANPASEKYLNIKKEGAIGKVATELFGTSEAPFLDVYSQVSETGKPVSFEQYFEPMGKHFFISTFSPKKGEFATVFLDISESKNHELELIAAKEKADESESRLKLAIASGKLGIWDWNLIENSMIWDDRMFELYGITKDTFTRNVDVWINGLHPDDKQQAIDDCNAALNGERVLDHSFRVVHPDGNTLYLKANGSVLRDENGKPVRMIGINRDITEYQLATQQLQVEKEKAEESEIVFRKLFEDSTDAQFLFKDGKFTNCNKTAIKLLGADSTSDIVGLSPTDVSPEVQPDGRPTLEAAAEYTQMAFENDSCHFEWICKRFDGTLRLIDITLIPIVLKGEKILHGNWRDITDRKKAEAALIESEKRYRNLFQKSYAIMLLIDSDTGTLIDANPSACAYYGWAREELIGKNIAEINIESAIDVLAELNLAKLEQRNHFVFKHRLADNSIRDVEVYSSPLEVSGKTVLYSIIHDITDRKQTEEALVIAKEKAEESDRLKSVFLANMSHEIRTPLNSIIGFSELLTDPGFEPEQKVGFTKGIIENGNNLLVIINDIMDLSMLEAHQIKVKKEKFHIKDLLKDLRNEFGSKANNKSLKFLINAAEVSDDLIIETDFYRIKQIFNNLIGNALKFTKTGFIEVGFCPVQEFFEFSVKDTGIGIAPEFHNDIFERFRQVDESKTRKYGGNGLGLAISKNLVEVLGGKIRLESEPGKGSTFYFTIPKPSNGN